MQSRAWPQVAFKHMDVLYGDCLFTDVVIDICTFDEVAEIVFKDWRFLMRLDENALMLKSNKSIITYELLE